MDLAESTTLASVCACVCACTADNVIMLVKEKKTKQKTNREAPPPWQRVEEDRRATWFLHTDINSTIFTGALDASSLRNINK